jgi:phage terminase large subunit-like protein
LNRSCEASRPHPLRRAWAERQLAALKTADDAAAEAIALEILTASWPWIAHDAQLAPAGGWRTWLFMGGRGAGKTRAGAEWVAGEVAAGRARRIALVAPTLADVREVMIEGESGLRRVGRPETRPIYQVSRRRLAWPSGAEAYAFSAEDPESLRGPQFDLAWCDEIATWPRAEEVWSTLAFALRLGERPRVLATTTPRPVALVKTLAHAGVERGVAMTRATTHVNAAALAPGFVESLTAQFAGSHLLRQEMLGELIDDLPGALFERRWIEDWREPRMDPGRHGLDRVCVAVDPPATAGAGSAACGIIAAGRRGETILILEDATVRGLTPPDWAKRTIAAARRWGAGKVVAEANQGGEMVRSVLEHAGARLAGVRVELAHATRSKRDRAEPVAVLYEGGRVRHAGVFKELEDEMCAFGASDWRGSPDRLDAMVWAVGGLADRPARPRVTAL